MINVLAPLAGSKILALSPTDPAPLPHVPFVWQLCWIGSFSIILVLVVLDRLLDKKIKFDNWIQIAVLFFGVVAPYAATANGTKLRHWEQDQVSSLQGTGDQRLVFWGVLIVIITFVVAGIRSQTNLARVVALILVSICVFNYDPLLNAVNLWLNIPVQAFNIAFEILDRIGGNTS